MTAQPSDDEVMQRLSDALNTGDERAAEDRATQRAAKAVADAAGKTPK